MSWFSTWFDSPYYHLLYQHRDEQEAEFFIQNLLTYLKLPKSSRILDLACGKGRHSLFLHRQGYEVVGADLAAESIKAAQSQAGEGLQFVVHDMRQPLDMGDFDAVFNLFTSFGYFETEEEHQQSLASAAALIRNKKGVVVIDFMNAYKVIQTLVLAEEKQVGELVFRLRRRVENGYIVKEIAFEDKGQSYRFREQVRAFRLADFEQMFSPLGLQIEAVFGDYALNPFVLEESDRLILILSA